MRLAELQRAMQGHVLRGDELDSSLVHSTPQFDIAARRGVYMHAFHARLVAALATSYPAVQKALGEPAFGALTRAFVDHHPPCHFSIRYFGGELADFIAASHRGVRGRGLSELARWEWTLAGVFDAADAAPALPSALGAIAPERWSTLRFRMAPYVARIALSTNAVQCWRAFTRDARPPSRWRTRRPQEWIVWRSNLQTFFRSLSSTEAAAIDAARQSRTFGEICAGLAETGPAEDAPRRAALLLRDWFHDGWIVAVE